MCRKLLLAATALTLLAAPAVAAEAPEKAAAKAAAEYREQAKRLDPLAASVFWNQAFEANQRDEEAGVRLAAAMRVLGRYDQAVETARKVSLVNPKNLDAQLEVARAFIGKGQGFFAIEPARAAQALAPRDWRPTSLLGVALEQAERPAEAEIAYQQALALSPNNPAVLNNMAMFRAATGKPAEAESLLRQALGRPGATAQMRQNLSLVIGLQGRLDEAEALLRQDLPPDMVNNNLAYLRAALNAEPGAPRTAPRSWDSLRNPPAGG